MTLYQSLAEEFSSLIGGGAMRAGDRLPSVRRLAMQKGLSISTVVQALRTLETRGLVEARPQSGYYVRPQAPGLRAPESARLPAAAVEVGVTQRVLQVLRAVEAPGVVPFGSALPAPELLPVARLNRLYASLARRHPALLAGTSHGGLNEPALVHAIVRRSVAWGGPIRPEELVVTNSCSEAMALCLRAVTRPGDTVAVETPTYYLMLQLLESLGLKALEIPTDPRSGISVEALELATRDGRVAACLFVANGGNPLGTVVPDAAKARIARLLAERQVPLIEDDIYGDLCYAAERPKPIHAFDASGNVMLCASFSKTLCPALRVGYVAAGRRAAEVAMHKTLASGRTNPLTQRVAAEFVDGGGYDVHLRRLRRSLRGQVGCLRAAVAEHFPPGTGVSDPAGGFVLWVELPAGVDALAVHRQALAEGIGCLPGELFSARGEYRNCLRLAAGMPWNAAREDAVRRLGRVAAQVAAAWPGPPAAATAAQTRK